MKTLGRWRLHPGARWLGTSAAAIAALCVASLIVAAAALVVHKSPAYFLVLVAALPLEYVLCRLTVNIWHAGLTITNAEIVIAGATRTHRVPIDEAERFEPGVADTGRNGTPMIVLHRRGGEPIGISTFSRQGFVWNFAKLVRSLQPQANELNRVLAVARASAT